MPEDAGSGRGFWGVGLHVRGTCNPSDGSSVPGRVIVPQDRGLWQEICGGVAA